LKKVIAKPHLFFFGLIPIFIVIGLIKGSTPIDFNVSYIYYLLNVDFWCYVSSVFFALIGLNYLALDWAKKPPKKWLTLIHIILQIVSLLPYLFTIFNLDSDGNLDSTRFLGIANLESVLSISFLIFIVSVFVHLVNFFTSLFLKTD
jgi:hypothetical protein